MCLIPLYFFLFKTLILHFDIKTPGRDRSIKIKMFTKVDYKAQQSAEHEDVQPRDSDVPKDKYTLIAEQAIIAYGGKDNIKNVDACITKLRVQIVDQSKVNKDMLIGLGARGVIKPSPQSVYAVFGNEADIIKNRMNDILKIGGLQ
jgi:glucose-like phosphotransferase system IIB component